MEVQLGEMMVSGSFKFLNGNVTDLTQNLQIKIM